ncbi:hypothetical protein OCU04_002053 [Sclerotinia nivalis]|uniref:Uncharacterized protein n=1 Tax=Sclerotinia nivalis TaxID=352851 RepID=A0A9X0AZD0_9HELO|nr:hypothetical protein OCU04_002053 [Sclerotinia nivalis]
MNSDSEYYQLLVRFARSNDQAIRRPLPKFAIMESEDSIQMYQLSSPTLREHKSTAQNHHWDVISEWNRLSQAKDGFWEPQQENIEELESDQEDLISEREKSSQVQDDVQEPGRETEQTPQRLRGDNRMFQRGNIATCVIICGLVLFFLIQSSAVDLLQYGQYLLEDLLMLFVFPIDGL